MRRLLLSAVLLLCIFIGMNAQTKLTYNGPIGIDWKFKRTITSGSTLVMDFIVENNTSKDIRCVVCSSLTASWGKSALKAYDDEGNVYESNALMGGVPFSGKIGGKNSLFDWETIPTGNLIKVRLQLAGVDEFATLIKTLSIPIITDYNGQNQTYSELRVTNIIIPRE